MKIVLPPGSECKHSCVHRQVFEDERVSAVFVMQMILRAGMETRPYTKNVGDGALDVPPYSIRRRHLDCHKAITSLEECILNVSLPHTQGVQGLALGHRDQTA